MGEVERSDVMVYGRYDASAGCYRLAWSGVEDQRIRNVTVRAIAATLLQQYGDGNVRLLNGEYGRSVYLYGMKSDVVVCHVDMRLDDGGGPAI